MTDGEEGRLAFERDIAIRQAELSKADLQVAKLALNENRPLEALRVVNEAIDRLDDELDGLTGGIDDPGVDEDLDDPASEATDEDVEEAVEEVQPEPHQETPGEESVENLLDPSSELDTADEKEASDEGAEAADDQAVCEPCGYQFDSEDALDSHREEMHDGVELSDGEGDTTGDDPAPEPADATVQKDTDQQAGAEDEDDDVDERADEDVQADVDEDYADERESYGVYTARDYGIALSGVQAHFETDRISVVTKPYGADLVPGDDADGPDYSVSSNNIQLGNPGRKEIGADAGDDIRAVPDGDVVRLELVTGEGEASEETDRDSGSDDGKDDVDAVNTETVLEELETIHEEGKSWAKASEIADRYDVASQKIGSYLKKLHDAGLVERYNENRSQTGWQSVEWAASHDDAASERWCGYCGAGPLPSAGAVEDHHDEEDHPGDPVVLDADPGEDGAGTDADDERVVDAANEDGDGEHRIGDELGDVEEEPAADGVGGDADVDLPDGLTADGLREFVDNHEGLPYLGVMADRFDLTEGRMRTIVVELGIYGDVMDASEPRGGGA